MRKASRQQSSRSALGSSGAQWRRVGLAAVREAFGESGHWSHVGHVYRRMLLGIGGDTESKRGFSQEVVDAVMARDGKLSRTQLLLCGVRYSSFQEPAPFRL